MRELEERNVVIVNSDRLILKNLTEALKKSGYSILASECALKAAELIQEQPIHLLICDTPKKTASPKEIIRFEQLVNIAKDNLKDHSHEEPADLENVIQRAVVDLAESLDVEGDLAILILKLGKAHLPQINFFATARFRSEMQQLREIRHFIAHHCLKVPGDPTVITTLLQLASNEAFCNIVNHGYKEQDNGVILVHLSSTIDGIYIEIADQGLSFDPEKVPLPDVAGGQLRGFGWYIIVKISDELSYVPRKKEGEWNRLRIFKKFCFKGKKMQLAEETKEGVLIITPQVDRLDANDTTEFKEKMNILIKKHDIQKVVLDLHHVQFIDSSGLGAFLSLLRSLHAHGGELKLACLNKQIRTLFELVSMHKVFEIFNTTSDAVSSFSIIPKSQ